MRLRIREEHRAMPAYEKPPAWRVDVYLIGPFRGGNKPPVLPGKEKGFSKAKNGELKAAEVVAKN